MWIEVRQPPRDILQAKVFCVETCSVCFVCGFLALSRVCLIVCLSVLLFVYPSYCVSIRLIVYLSVLLFVYPSYCLSIRLIVYLSVLLSVYPSYCLSVSLLGCSSGGRPRSVCMCYCL